MFDSRRTKSKRGGKRPGAGRKPLPPGKHRVTVSVRLPPAVAKMLDELCSVGTRRNRTSVIARAIERIWSMTLRLPRILSRDQIPSKAGK